MRSLIVIPARWGSSRFPGKPLINIAGKSMIERVYTQCKMSKADEVLVATDNEQIYNAVLAFGGKVVLTSTSHLNGTSRCGEVLEKLVHEQQHFKWLVNVQGDEPFIDPDHINQLLDAAITSNADVLTRIVPANEKEALNPNVVKVVCGHLQQSSYPVLYFSRSVIPFQRHDGKKVQYFRHIGIYAFRTNTIHKLIGLPKGELELSEHLEQLRWMEHGYRVHAVLGQVSETAPAVDTPEDLMHVENFLKTHPDLR